jgi:hypothetical protein
MEVVGYIWHGMHVPLNVKNFPSTSARPSFVLCCGYLLVDLIDAGGRFLVISQFLEPRSQVCSVAALGMAVSFRVIGSVGCVESGK